MVLLPLRASPSPFLSCASGRLPPSSPRTYLALHIHATADLRLLQTHPGMSRCWLAPPWPYHMRANATARGAAGVGVYVHLRGSRCGGDVQCACTAPALARAQAHTCLRARASSFIRIGGHRYVISFSIGGARNSSTPALDLSAESSSQLVLPSRHPRSLRRPRPWRRRPRRWRVPRSPRVYLYPPRP